MRLLQEFMTTSMSVRAWGQFGAKLIKALSEEDDWRPRGGHLHWGTTPVVTYLCVEHDFPICCIFYKLCSSSFPCPLKEMSMKLKIWRWCKGSLHWASSTDPRVKLLPFSSKLKLDNPFHHVPGDVQQGFVYIYIFFINTQPVHVW